MSDIESYIENEAISRVPEKQGMPLWMYIIVIPFCVILILFAILMAYKKGGSIFKSATEQLPKCPSGVVAEANCENFLNIKHLTNPVTTTLSPLSSSIQGKIPVPATSPTIEYMLPNEYTKNNLDFIILANRNFDTYFKHYQNNSYSWQDIQTILSPIDNSKHISFEFTKDQSHGSVIEFCRNIYTLLDQLPQWDPSDKGRGDLLLSRMRRNSCAHVTPIYQYDVNSEDIK